MKLNVFCESRSSHTEDQMTSSGSTEWRSLYHQKGGTASPEVMPWGVFAAFAVTLASTGFLFVMALTGGLNLG